MGDFSEMNKKVAIIGPYHFEYPTHKDTAFEVIPNMYRSIDAGVSDVYLITGNQVTPMVGEMVHALPKLKLLEIAESIGQPLKYLRYIMNACKKIKKNKIGVITALYGATSFGFDAALIGFFSRTPVLIMAGNREIYTHRIIGLYEGIKGKIRLLADWFREFVALNLSTIVINFAPGLHRAQELSHRTLNKSKIVFCPKGVDTEAYMPRKNKFQEESDVFTVAYVGRKSAEKGYHFVIEAAELLKDLPLQYIFAGNFDPGKKGNVKFVGYIDPRELKHFYNSIDAVVLPSFTEGFPRVIGNAMASGKPCIISRHLFDGYFTDKENVIFCETNAEDVARKILLLYENPELAREIGLNAREFIVNNLDKKKWWPVYRSLLLGLSAKKVS